MRLDDHKVKNHCIILLYPQFLSTFTVLDNCVITFHSLLPLIMETFSFNILEALLSVGTMGYLVLRIVFPCKAFEAL